MNNYVQQYRMCITLYNIVLLLTIMYNIMYNYVKLCTTMYYVHVQLCTCTNMYTNKECVQLYNIVHPCTTTYNHIQHCRNMFNHLQVCTSQGSTRPDLDHRDRDRDWKCLSLNNETETETEKVWVSMTRPRPRLKNLSLKNETETETGKIWVSKTRLGKKCRYRDSIKTHADLWYDTGLLVGWSRFFLPYRAYSAIKSQNLML